jgi:DNA-binding GntR family transcriptional regulator
MECAVTTSLSRVEQAVTEARDELIGFALVALPNEPGFAGAERRADALVAAVRRQALHEAADLMDAHYTHTGADALRLKAEEPRP